jgi:hypothetical protein
MTQESRQKRKNRPMTRRVAPDHLPRRQETARDLAIIEAVYRYRALHTRQVEQLFFPAVAERTSTQTSSQCLKRLQYLFHAGYLTRAEQPQMLSEGRKPLVYFLDTRGARLLQEVLGEEKLDWHAKDNQVKSLFIEHLLQTNDIRIAVTLACRREGLMLDTWLDEKTLKRPHMKDYVLLRRASGRTYKAAVVPDGYFVVTQDVGDYLNSYHFALEVDRGTVTGVASREGRRDWARKVEAYLAYHASGLYAQRYGTQSLRIITVTTGDQRLANLKRVTEEAGGKARFWFTTFDRTTAEAILTEPIWQVAGREGQFTLIQ